MASLETLFVTRIYRASLGPRMAKAIGRCCLSLKANDKAGRDWCRANAYAGYTSYASLNDLPWRFPEFAELAERLAPHVQSFARSLEFELGGRRLALDSLWANVLAPGGAHGSHLHPHSVISGTFYVAVPDGASAIRFEDPRLGLMMAAPVRHARARRDNRQFVSMAPRPGTLLLWESWLRHDVPPNAARTDRISVSFNYAWK